MPHRPNRSYVSNSDAFDEMALAAREILRTLSASSPAGVGAEAFAEQLQERSGITMDGLPASSWIGKVLDRVTKDAESRGEESLTSLVVLRAPASRTRTVERRPAVRRPEPTPQAREMTCPSCWMIVPEAATCRSCGEPLPAAPSATAP